MLGVSALRIFSDSSSERYSFFCGASARAEARRGGTPIEKIAEAQNARIIVLRIAAPTALDSAGLRRVGAEKAPGSIRCSIARAASALSHSAFHLRRRGRPKFREGGANFRARKSRVP